MSYFNYKTASMYYEIYGEGQPVLLIHGWSLDHNFLIGCLEPVFNELSDGFQRYYVDLPGMGTTEPGFICNGDDYIEILTAFIEQIVISKKQENCFDSVLLVGNSFGGMLACGIAHEIPTLIKGMILIAGSTGSAVRKLPPRKLFKEDKEFLKTLTKKQYEDFYDLNMTLTKKAWDQYEKYIYPAILENQNNDFLNHIADGTISYDLYETNADQQFMNPVLFVTGKQDTCVGFEDPFELSKCYPESTFVAINGAGHNVWVDQPEEFHEIVSSWIRWNMI